MNEPQHSTSNTSTIIMMKCEPLIDCKHGLLIALISFKHYVALEIVEGTGGYDYDMICFFSLDDRLLSAVNNTMDKLIARRL